MKQRRFRITRAFATWCGMLAFAMLSTVSTNVLTGQTQEAKFQKFWDLLEQHRGELEDAEGRKAKKKIRQQTAEKVLQLVEDCENNDHVVTMLKWVLENNPKDRDVQTQVMEVVESRLADHEQVFQLINASTSKEFLQKIIETNSNKKAKAVASLFLISSVSDEDEREAGLLKLVEEFGDVRYHGQKLAKSLAPQLALLKLRVGKVAPDIVGLDIDGVEFKLSDYRGKVVMLDFWGDW